ncbi:uncharacterized protein TRAVEDRAFT_127494 [Trametes versicolor FP-101664 SS1]|uniref:uncharacterized protein n=1 Tax=Trametes versicolor (strain FP-101664) TaxID=717944 RepID=UPI0004621E78|nr:uncharacterized protein TRAVEDRAFT_127494 [Trametes versicolor FP-101664 SS1]EIW56860.1 hypothetical protein TRAVEDRAFT_127494 [Trametes versicolor FP-101664 SS1]
MVKLDARGYIAIVEIVIYAPLLLVIIPVVFRNGFARKAGWIYLLLLSIFRIVGGVTHILSEQNPTDKTLQTVYTVTESAGLSQLLIATCGFLGTVTQHSLDQRAFVKTGLLLLELLGTGALVLVVISGTKSGNAKTQSQLDQATTFRHIGIIVFGVLYFTLVGATAFCWINRQTIPKYRRKLLLGIACALPFLGVRVLYGILSAFVPSQLGFDAEGHLVLMLHPSSLSKFSTTTGSWALFLTMSVAMEYAVVLTYTVVGIRTPLHKDTDDAQARGDYVRTPTVAVSFPPAVGTGSSGRWAASDEFKSGGGYATETGGYAPQRGGYA